MIDTDGLWETYHHIAKLHELGADERGNTWDQETYGQPNETMIPDSMTVLKEPQYLCKTGMCFAGWYAMLHGQKINMLGETVLDNNIVAVSHYTIIRAGINSLDAQVLFRGTNSLYTIRHILIEITGVDRG